MSKKDETPTPAEYVPPTHVPVTVHRVQGEVAVVLLPGEVEGDVRAVVLPLKAVRESVTAPGSPYVLESDADAAQPYGIPWEEIIKIKSTPKAVAIALRKYGIHTGEDARTRPNDVGAAIREALGIDLSAILTLAESYIPPAPPAE